MHCLYLCGSVEADSGKNNTMSLSWHNPVYGSSACGILMRLGDREGKLGLYYTKELQFQVSYWLTFATANQLTSKKGLPPGPAVRMAVSAGIAFSWQAWQAWYLARASAHSFPA